MPSHKWARFRAAFGSQSDRYARWSALAEQTLKKLGEARAVLGQLDAHAAAQHDVAIQAFMERLRDAQQRYDDEPDERSAAIAELSLVDEGAHALLKTLRQALKQDLDALVAAPGGVKVLDQMVEDTKVLLPDLEGGLHSARSAFLRDAMKARFGLSTLEQQRGPGGRDNLRSAYLTMAKVPLTHTLHNDRLDGLKLKPTATKWKERKYGGVYMPSENEIDVIIAQVLPNASRDCDDEVPQEHRAEGGLSGFQGTVLHEVGHAYDAKAKVMSLSADTRTALGGWRKETSRSVATLLVRETGLATSCPEFPESFLIDYLEQAVRVRSPNLSSEWEERRGRAEQPVTADMLRRHSKVVEAVAVRAEEDSHPSWPDGVCPRDVSMRLNNGAALGFVDPKPTGELRNVASKLVQELIQEVLAGADVDATIQALLQKHAEYAGPMPSLDGVKEHRAYKVARALQSHYKGTYYQTGRSGAERTQVGDITFTVDSKQLYSYEMSARDAGVSKYQFRAPAEFFAELYMFFFAGKLPLQHPLYSELEAVM
ncbi:MAG: hypothetical protein H6740_21485 [Alphaproteobacteria bacterium]|nr:hypothetical protein [Alphaproteobacteria bacterium]